MSFTTDEILTLDDIATMYRVTRERARAHIVKQPGFPEIAPGTTWRLPGWSTHKVRQYIRGASPEKAPKRREPY